jgi:plasmid maintenance system antidote protein VapI
MTSAHDPRTVPVPADILEEAKRALAELGPKRAGERLGISRNAVISIVATARAMPGTVALAEQHLKAEFGK